MILKRFLSFLFLSLALALGFGPFVGGKLTRQSTTNVVLIAVILDKTQNKTAIAELDNLKLSNYPNLRAFVDNIKIETTPKALEKTTNNSPDSKEGYSSKDIVKLINQLEGNNTKKKDTTKQKPLYSQNEYTLEIDSKKWQSLKNDLNLKTDKVIFKIDDIYLKNKSKSTVKKVLIKVKWFNKVRYILAVLFLFFGFILARGLYKKLPGINLNPRWVAKVGDLIAVLFLSIGGFCALEFLLNTFTGMDTYFNDMVFTQMGALFYVPAIIIFTFFNTKQFSQSVEITKEGVTIYYPKNEVFIKWQQIKNFELSASYLAVSRLDLPIPKKLQTYLVIKTEKESYNLVEPGLKSIKKKVLLALKNNCQENLLPQIDIIIDKW